MKIYIPIGAYNHEGFDPGEVPNKPGAFTDPVKAEERAEEMRKEYDIVVVFDYDVEETSE